MEEKIRKIELAGSVDEHWGLMEIGNFSEGAFLRIQPIEDAEFSVEIR